MTLRDRVREMLADGKRPTIGWGEADLKVGRDLREVLNPFGRALAAGENLNSVYEASLEVGEARLEAYVDATRRDLAQDGDVLYRLVGADPTLSTPMQYGGLYLERDRDLLTGLSGGFHALYVDAPGEAFLDVVCDLPVDVFLWDDRATQTAAASLRVMRAGPMGCKGPDAEFRLVGEPKPLKEPSHV